MIALIGAFGLFHLAEQGIHFWYRQTAISAHGGMAGERTE